MENISTQDYRISIEESSSIITKNLGNTVVESVFQRYGAHNADDLNPAYLPDIFNELYAIESDLR